MFCSFLCSGLSVIIAAIVSKREDTEAALIKALLVTNNGSIIPASIIFEDDICMAFMDVFPIKEGHCLLIPKEHFTNMLDVDLDVAAHMNRRLAELTRRVYEVYKPVGIMNIAANGPEAGQEVPHLHFHVIPRNKSDGFGFRFPDGYREKIGCPVQVLVTEQTGFRRLEEYRCLKDYRFNEMENKT